MKVYLNNFLADMLWCKKCELSKSRDNVVVGDGNDNADILIIGAYPQKEEDKTGVPFKGKVNKIIRELISEAGIKDKIYMTNIVKCKPPGNRNPSDIEVNFCIKHLQRQVSQIQPKAIVGIGNFVSNKILNTINMAEDHGKITKLNKNLLFMPIYDINVLYKNPDLADEAVEELIKLNQLI